MFIRAKLRAIQRKLTARLSGVFFLLLLLAGYAGLTSLQLDTYINDKLLHIFTFFLLTVTFYWIIDTNRRRTLNLTLVVCTAGLGVGSEFLQGVLPNDRNFDFYDVFANVVGSLAGLGLCSWYHKRMLERKRSRKPYNVVPGEDMGEDIELGERVGEPHEEGIVESGMATDHREERPIGEREGSDDQNELAANAWDSNDDGDIGAAKN